MAPAPMRVGWQMSGSTTQTEVVEVTKPGRVALLHVDGVEPSVPSGPPSPPSPSEGKTTPRLTIAPCPPRLRSLIPPFNYGTVEVHSVYRSSFPQDRNLEFLSSLKIKSVLKLVDTEPTDAFQQWLTDSNINQAQIHIATNKTNTVNTTMDSLCEALLFVMDGANHPLYIHCNQGKHRTGCVVACLRRIQGVPVAEIIQEYYDYAYPKVREGDLELIKSFDPSQVLAYAKRSGLLDEPRFDLFKGCSEIRTVDRLAAVLASFHPRLHPGSKCRGLSYCLISTDERTLDF